MYMYLHTYIDAWSLYLGPSVYQLTAWTINFVSSLSGEKVICLWPGKEGRRIE